MTKFFLFRFAKRAVRVRAAIDVRVAMDGEDVDDEGSLSKNDVATASPDLVA